MPTDESRTAERREALSAYPLRLTAARGGLGVELYRPLRLGPLTVHDLAWSLPGVRFPVDLSGGVRSFSNRRGELVRFAVATDPEALARWLSPRVRDLLGGLEERPSVWFVDGGIGVGLWCRGGAVAFDVLWAPDGNEARLVVSNARGAGFPGPALAQALAATDAAVGKLGQRKGRLVSLGLVAQQLVRRCLPELGVRAPATGRVVLSGLVREGDELGTSGGDPGSGAVADAPELPPVVGRAIGLAQLLEAGDEALLGAHPEAARAAYVTALETAPRHPEICLLVASLDASFADRAEAALGLLVESLPATSFGSIGAELLAKAGDFGGAELAVEKMVSLEPFAPLAALAWTELAELAPSVAKKLQLLDRAVATCARSHEARWARLVARLATSDVNGAVADAEHLEAAARGSEARHEALLRAARSIQTSGFVGPAGRLFQRALRYLPDAPAAALGLAESLIATGHERRALPLLTRASASDDEATQSRACLVLGKLLASAYSDLPQGIAQLARVSRARADDAIEARALEARFRARLGDVAGAALAYARLHDTVETSPALDASRAVPHLLDAGRFAAEELADAHAGHRYLGLALRLVPNDPRVQSAYREVAGLLAPKPAT